MSRKLHLHTVTTTGHDPFDPFDPTAPLSVPLGGGLVAVVHDGPTPLTVADLSVHRNSAALLWQQAATDMLGVLGDLTAVHGTALRHRDDGGGVREIAVIGAPFPAAGLIAHPCSRSRRTASCAGTTTTSPLRSPSTSPPTNACSSPRDRHPRYRAPARSTSRPDTARR